jgi:hypothetical protein
MFFPLGLGFPPNFPFFPLFLLLLSFLGFFLFNDFVCNNIRLLGHGLNNVAILSLKKDGGCYCRHLFLIQRLILIFWL